MYRNTQRFEITEEQYNKLKTLNEFERVHFFEDNFPKYGYYFISYGVLGVFAEEEDGCYYCVVALGSSD